MSNDLTQYEYQVTLVTDYCTITTGTALWLDDNQGNCSDEAREQAIKNAIATIKDELGITSDTMNYWDSEVKLILDDDEILV